MMIKKSFKTGLLFLFIGTMISSCNSIKFSSNYDDTEDFTKLKTYEYFGWDRNSGSILNDIEKGRIEKAFEAELSKRGMKYVKSDGDVIVTLYIVTKQESQTTATTTGMGGMYGGYGGYYGYGPGYGWGGGMATTTYNTYDYTVGTLVIDIYNANDKKLIFEASAQGTVDDKGDASQDRVNKVVTAIMKNYPITPPKK